MVLTVVVVSIGVVVLIVAVVLIVVVVLLIVAVVLRWEGGKFRANMACLPITKEYFRLITADCRLSAIHHAP